MWSELMVTLFVIDPGFVGGVASHHTAVVQTIVDEIASGSTPFDRVVVFGHESARMRASLDRGGASVVPFFRTHFYSYRGMSGGSESFRFIADLAGEYAALAELVDGLLESPRDRCLYVSVQWPHALALKIAERIANRGARRCVVCADGSDIAIGSHFGIDAAQIYSSALGWLRENRHMRVLFPCRRHAEQAFPELAAVDDREMPIHGNMLSIRSPVPMVGPSRVRLDVSVARLGIYVGDIKEEKGFCRLPRRVALMTRDAPEGMRLLVIVPLLERSRPEIAVLDQLRSMVRAGSRLELHVGDVDGSEFERKIDDLDALLLDYDAVSYGNRLSGLCLMASGAGKPVSFTSECLPHQELIRLGSFTAVADDELLRSSIREGFVEFASGGGSVDYRAKVLGPFVRTVS